MDTDEMDTENFSEASRNTKPTVLGRSANSSSNSSSASSSTSSSSSSSSSTSVLDDLPWIEKHRPRTLDEVVGNNDAIARLRVIAANGNMPNLLLAGPPGTGKTTAVMCLARQLLGPQVDSAVLELNASDQRGIDVVRTRIKAFAQKKVTLPAGRHKIIILDEADSMTSSAQQALRRTMELYSNTTRFALACNTSAKIIEPIQSRCAIVRYTRLDDREVLKRVREVMEAEHVNNFSNEGLDALLFVAQGDLRNALNALQSTWVGQGAITPENIYKVVDQPHPITVKAILEYCVGGQLREALQETHTLKVNGYSTMDVIGTLFRVTKNAEMSEKKKLAFIKEISETHLRLADGCDTPLQLNALVARLTQIAMDSA